MEDWEGGRKGRRVKGEERGGIVIVGVGGLGVVGGDWNGSGGGGGGGGLAFSPTQGWELHAF